ncbi:pyridoxal phosphate-dependent decarboxylase family protein [Streptomyces abikoensis]|uniref:pyridoxal phosphate-dependent decarboxylase family protein n=1 Tax=Streptomyces abikoensis TaxID=97398 RepID=UPI001E29AC3A|nr:pyridoxal-dependent decarboxylase [Streptomyces abikoensis]
MSALAAGAALAGGVAGPGALRPLLDAVLAGLADGAALRGGPLPAGGPAGVAAFVAAALGDRDHRAVSATGEPAAPSDQGHPGEALADDGNHPARGRASGPAASGEPPASGEDVLRRLTTLLARGSADPADPACAAHLHCPPLALAVAADLAVSALNPSQDSWDQAPASTELETALVRDLAALVGYDPATAAGVITSGGTESNLMGLMLSRDHALGRAGGHATELGGLPRDLSPRIFASEAAHFSVQRAAAVLGLGERAVTAVPVDRDLRMDPAALDVLLKEAVGRGETPVAIVATAGTTDTGGIDPLPQIADIAERYGVWLHVDAAYGGGALLSDRLAPLLAGVERADSLSLDWHKLGWQPAPAGVFLVRRAETYAPLARRAVYLNPADDEEAGYPSLLGLSLRTTRRPDAFKIAATLAALGRAGLGRLVDTCHDLAHHAAATVRAHPLLELHTTPVLTTAVFRYRPASGLPADADRVNAALRRRLLTEGRAVVGRTELPGRGPGRVRLKLTLLNPHTTPAQVDALLSAVVAAGQAEERDETERAGEPEEVLDGVPAYSLSDKPSPCGFTESEEHQAKTTAVR